MVKLLLLWMLALAAGAVEAPLYQRDTHTMPDYRYVVDQVLEVVDGDTIEVSLDLGFNITYKVRVRILGVDTPEKVGDQKAYGLAVKDWSKRWVAAQKGPLYLVSKQWDKYGGRVLGDLQLQDGTSYSALLVARGLGRAYQGEAKPPWTKAQLDAALAAAGLAVDAH